ncbi:MAG TPA: cytochrome c/FTR1 family iron permease [Flavobacteriales bacterium]|nr:cytochrome c/FTR1 family iron permease [Flavobacteriales bacterium]
MRQIVHLGLVLALAMATGLGHVALAAEPQAEQARTVVHMLDYVGADYPEFVQGGVVLDSAEYAEQLEFAMQVRDILGALPRVEGAADLLAMARKLEERIQGKAEGVDVSALAKALRNEVIAMYEVTMAPPRPPDRAQGSLLYNAHCASCHGDTGHGDGLQGEGLEPAPRDFHDQAAMAVRSPFGLYNTITLGVPGTSMQAYSALSDEERWALAFHSAGLRATPEELQRGEALWKQGKGKELFANLTALVNTTPEEAVQALGPDGAAIMAWLVAHPDAVLSAAPSPLNVSRARLQEALEAYRQQDMAGARRLSIAAYLEGFELVEAALDNVDAPLRKRTEREMMTLRSLISAQAPADSVAASVGRIQGLLDQAEATLSAGGLSPAAIFFSSLLILFREGLEAILVLAAIIAFVLKTGRRDALPYIHAGWMAAVLLGVGTWLLARYAINISGAGRELTEGITALLAALMLLYVGYWLHNKSNAQAWQHFVRDKVGAALGKKTMWTLAGISFFAVYRELFEIILFYETLFSQAGPGNGQALLGGIGAAAVLLVVIGAAILKYSVRLPLGPFFAVTGIILALMAVVFVGNGVAALQEAGVFDATFVRFITVPVLGIHPTLQSLVAQGTVLLLVAFAALWGRMHAVRVGKA